jgi:CRISPR-associated protein Cmr5
MPIFGGTLIPTREQERAQRAYAKVSAHQNTGKEAQSQYKRFSKSFPALLHTCGLAQAIAYGQAQDQQSYMFDLAYVVGQANAEELAHTSRETALPLYQKHSRDALAAATWLKRYAEALLEGDD